MEFTEAYQRGQAKGGLLKIANRLRMSTALGYLNEFAAVSDEFDQAIKDYYHNFLQETDPLQTPSLVTFDEVTEEKVILDLVRDNDGIVHLVDRNADGTINNWLLTFEQCPHGSVYARTVPGVVSDVIVTDEADASFTILGPDEPLNEVE